MHLLPSSSGHHLRTAFKACQGAAKIISFFTDTGHHRTQLSCLMDSRSIPTVHANNRILNVQTFVVTLACACNLCSSRCQDARAPCHPSTETKPLFSFLCLLTGGAYCSDGCFSTRTLLNSGHADQGQGRRQPQIYGTCGLLQHRQHRACPCTCDPKQRTRPISMQSFTTAMTVPHSLEVV